MLETQIVESEMATTDDRREVELYIRIENTNSDNKEFQQWVRQLVLDMGGELGNGEIISSYGIREVSDGQNRSTQVDSEASRRDP